MNNLAIFYSHGACQMDQTGIIKANKVEIMRQILAALTAAIIATGVFVPSATAASFIGTAPAAKVAATIATPAVGVASEAKVIEVRGRGRRAAGVAAGLIILGTAAVLAHEARRDRRYYNYNSRPRRIYRGRHRCQRWLDRCELDGIRRACQKFNRRC